MREFRLNGLDIEVHPDHEEASKALAERTRNVILREEHPFLGKATGTTPVRSYQINRELLHLIKHKLPQTKTGNLDDYLGIRPNNPLSYRYEMNENLYLPEDGGWVTKGGMLLENTHVPNIFEILERLGYKDLSEEEALKPDMIAKVCVEYERTMTARRVHQQTLGLGRTGHIAFNEPGSEKDSITRAVDLDPISIGDNSGKTGEAVPTRAITMGIKTILNAVEIVMMATDPTKAPAVRRTVYDPISSNTPSTFLRTHGNTRLILDEAAASELPK